MYNKNKIDALIKLINQYDGIADKDKLAHVVMSKFNLSKEGKIYICNDFSIRFCMSNTRSFCGTVIALSKLIKYDKKPFLVCVVTPELNYTLIANTTFINKISLTSHQLEINNIRGSFNGSDIIKNINGIENKQNNFELLFDIHSKTSLDDNIKRIVINTHEITPIKEKFEITPVLQNNIFKSIQRANNFINSNDFIKLKNKLDTQTFSVKDELVKVAQSKNNRRKGQIIEYLIISEDFELKSQIKNALKNNTSIPKIPSKNSLGDVSGKYAEYAVEIDIKAKIMSKKSMPKGYNIDKLLKFLSQDNSVYLIYLVGIKANGEIITRLCSVFDERLLDIGLIKHWAGRNSRGVSQFHDKALQAILNEEEYCLIDNKNAKLYLNTLINK